MHWSTGINDQRSSAGFRQIQLVSTIPISYVFRKTQESAEHGVVFLGKFGEAALEKD